MKITFIGTGRMGTELALHLLDHDLTVWNRTPKKHNGLSTPAHASAKTPATPTSLLPHSSDPTLSAKYSPT
ncbi:NAD(P)-binding domain-containing protein [Corynebacterium belfantii]|uniref:NAD(P)-binding domain-containing protein n=1 Tax=Corynebacterium belfantii TaxID=2014537 RepID=UPI00353105D5